MSNRRSEAGSPRDEPFDSAAELAGLGLATFPLHPIDSSGRCTCGDTACRNPGKHPRIKWKDGATTDLAQLRSLFRSSDVGVGVRTGAGLLVLDVDVKHGGRGLRSLEALQETYGALPHTARVLTGVENGQRGEHLWLRVPSDVYVKSSTNAFGDGLPGLDVRGDGGYAVAPPTRHKSGVRYEWATPADEIADAPDWLVALLASERPRFEAGGNARTPTRRRLSRDVLHMLHHGIPHGQQWDSIGRVARALLEVPYSVEEAADKLFAALEMDQDPADPWTWEKAYEEVQRIDLKERPELRIAARRRQRKPYGRSTGSYGGGGAYGGAAYGSRRGYGS